MIKKETIQARLKLRNLNEKSLDELASEFYFLGFVTKTFSEKGQIVQDELFIESGPALFQQTFQTTLVRIVADGLTNYVLRSPAKVPDYLSKYISEVSIMINAKAQSDSYQNL
ncbi:hypothetical protein HYW20_00440 [Candidatus Woesearchaeota archaeon]|nr:hypothetical protein [Candidatus Woesearchaeota archaeon]